MSNVHAQDGATNTDDAQMTDSDRANSVDTSREM